MNETKARQIVLAARPQGRPKPSDFRLEETAIPTPSAGQILLRVQYLSLDPYMRGRMDDRKSYATPVPLGGVMQGESVATVIASKHPAYSEGDIVLAHTGWRTLRAVGSRGPAQARSGRRAGHDGARRTRDARVHRVWRSARYRQAQARRNGGRRGGEWTGRVAGRPARQDRRRKGGRHRGRPREVRVCEGRASLRCCHRSPRPRFRRQARGGLPERHRCLLRKRRRSRSGRRCCRCSTSSRASRSPA